MAEEKALITENTINDITPETEKAELIELWNKMKKHNELESGLTKDSLHAKYLRFTMEKEFVELLANPRYLHTLAQKDLLQDQRFLRYLKYLQYWRQPKYAKCIKHVHCLRFLELLQNDIFRKKCKEPQFIEMIHQNQYYHWYWAKTNEFQHKYQMEDDSKQNQQVLPQQDINNDDENDIDEDNDTSMIDNT